MSLRKEEADALRQCLRILSPHYSSEQRHDMIEGIDSFIRKGKWPAWDLKDIARLFYPGDQRREAHLESLMLTAIEKRELSGIGTVFRATDLASWVNCPPVPKYSPLRFMLPECMHETHPVAVEMSPSISGVNKSRRNSLDPAIDKAIERAGNTKLADVYLQLKELAIEEEKPFTGVVDGNALCYTNDNDEAAILTKNALGKRLKNRDR